MITFDIIEECAFLLTKEKKPNREEEIQTAKAIALIDEMCKLNRKRHFNLVSTHNSTKLLVN